MVDDHWNNNNFIYTALLKTVNFTHSDSKKLNNQSRSSEKSNRNDDNIPKDIRRVKYKYLNKQIHEDEDDDDITSVGIK